MSFRKTRVHQTGLSNADRNTSSLSPLKTKMPLHEPKNYLKPKISLVPFDSPVDSTVQKYKTWQKKMKNDFASHSPSENKLALKTDPPDFANFKKAESKKNRSYFPRQVTEQFSEFLKDSNVNLRSKFVKLDKEKKSGINSQEFFSFLDSVHAPEVLLKNSDQLFRELAGDEKLLRCSYIESLSSKQVTSPQYRLLEKNNKNAEEILEKQKVPVNQLEMIFNKGNRLRNAVKNKYSNVNELVKELQSRSVNNRIHLKELKGFLLSKVDGKAQDSEIKSLLSAYDYNKDLQTDASEVAKYLFMDNNTAQDYLHKKKRPIAPNRLVDQFPDKSPTKLKPLLLQIEQKMFTQGSNKFLPVFKAFDQDNDGYLTIEDFEQGLKANQITCTQSEAQSLFSFLDENSNGFVTFQEFCKKIQPNIITVNRTSLQETELSHINLSQPSTTFYESQKSRLPPLVNKTPEYSYKVTSRYSSSPPYKDTFPSFAPGRESPMFLNDEHRYFGKRFEPLNFNHEDKSRAQKVLLAKIESIHKLRQAQDSQIRIIENQKTQTDQENIRVKKQARHEYETNSKKHNE